MIDLNTETLLSFSEASARFPGRPHLATLHRWRLRGVRGIQLESCLIGGKRFTSLEALQRFSNQLDPTSSQPSLVLNAAAKVRNRKRVAAADFCRKAGL